LLPRVRGGLEELEQAIDEARIDRRSGSLTVTMLASFLQQWLLPRLVNFQERHPGIDLRIHTGAGLVDFLHSDVQAAVRFGTGDWPQLHVEKMLDEWLVPVCSKALFAKHGPIRTREDLKRIPLLHAKTEPWKVWPEITLSSDEWAPRGASFDDSVTIIRAAEASQGYALARWSLAAQDISNGRLVIASPTVIAAPRCYFFVCPPGYAGLDKIESFRAWLRDQCAKAPRPV
jgi:LysR family glycine cleavage system transcriptional activator